MTIRLVVIILLCSTAVAQTDYRHLRKSYPIQEYTTLEEWLGMAAELREHILVSTGLWPLPEKTPLNPVFGERIEREGYSIQSVALETLPGFYLTGTLYRPLGKDGPFPAILSPHGHWKAGRFEDTETASVPARAANFALQGYTVFTYSMIGYNETEELFPHRFEDRRHELWGFSAMGLQLWNSIRALDFLASLPGVDPDRIGMTGASGGGTQTYLLTAVDPRIQTAAPVNMISAHFQGGCVCENAPLLRLQATNIELGALVAPRPLLMVSTSGDWTKDTPRVEFPAIQAIYRLFRSEDRIVNSHFDYPHNYNRDSREAVYNWFARWLLQRTDPLSEKTIQPADESLLRVSLPEKPAGIEDVFHRWATTAAQQVEKAKPIGWKEISEYRREFGKALGHVLEGGMTASAPQLETFAPEGRSEAGPAVLIVHAGGASAGQAVQTAHAHRKNGHLAFLLKPYPAGDSFELPADVRYWTTYNPSTASIRINEIRAAAEEILLRPDVSRLDLVGFGEAGPLVLLARALLADIDRTIIDFNHFDTEADQSFLDRLFIPLLRRAGGFKTAAAMIVPGRLTIRNMQSGTLRDWLEDVYHAAGAGELLIFDEPSNHRPHF